MNNEYVLLKVSDIYLYIEEYFFDLHDLVEFKNYGNMYKKTEGLKTKLMQTSFKMVIGLKTKGKSKNLNICFMLWRL